MAKNHNDSRYVRKTKRNFERTLVELMEEKSINQITVKELAERVEVSRSTFYAYYDDVYSLLGEIEDRVMSELREQAKECELKRAAENTPRMDLLVFGQGLNYMLENERLLKILMGPNGSPTFNEKLKKLIGERISGIINERVPDMDKRYKRIIYDFLISGVTGLMQSWVKNGYEINPAEMQDTLEKLLYITMEDFAKRK